MQGTRNDKAQDQETNPCTEIGYTAKNTFAEPAPKEDDTSHFQIAVKTRGSSEEQVHVAFSEKVEPGQ